MGMGGRGGRNYIWTGTPSVRVAVFPSRSPPHSSSRTGHGGDDEAWGFFPVIAPRPFFRSLIMVLVMARPGAATCTVLRPMLEKLAATSRASEAATHLRTRRAGACELDPDLSRM